MGIRNIDDRLCDGCGICIDHCPMDVFRMDKEAKKARIVYPKDCMVCYVCETDCPEGAIILTPEWPDELVFPYDKQPA
ncbi:ferredoxin family protein [Chloroflexota bacterium]